MIARNITKRLATLLLITACASIASAQNAIGPLYSPYGGNEFTEGYTTDAEWFSPVDFDFDNRPIRKSSGYFFRYDKLSWAATGERTTIGDPNVVVLSEIIYRNAEIFPDGEPVPQYVINNGLQDVAPYTTFGWGNRYEFGHQNKGNGWMIGIIEGLDNAQENVYASGPQTSGFGSIHINFVTPPDYLRGFRDYFSNGDNSPGTVINGPGGPGSGTPDDLDGDLNEAVNVLVDAEDEPIAIITDFDDSSLFNVRFNFLRVRNTLETDAIEIMKTHQLDNRHKMQKRYGNFAEFAYGVRFLRMRDEFGFNGTSDLFKGLNTVGMVAVNQIVGPQIRGRWSTQRGRWNVDIDGRFVFGYNIQDFDQFGTWGEGMLTGEPNAPEVAQPTTFANGRREDDFSPLVEMRVESSYQITSSIALRLGYTAMFIDNISRASQLVQYRLPDWGIGEGGQQDIFLNGVNVGFDLVY
ncbi:MAG: BBP7 family outer membrane beta-barrel protein [Planctomycetales bacterium]|nr:BBP7 family outer membrane beta-barrel protein [Planctomycetales bacterium]